MSGPPRPPSSPSLPAIAPLSLSAPPVELREPTSGRLSQVSPAGPLSHAVTSYDTGEGTEMPKVCPVCRVRYPADFKVCPRDATELADHFPSSDRHDEYVGKTLGETYTIIRIIGEGGMGRVYEAIHTRITSKRFAIKLLHPEYSRQPEVISRFQREAEAAAAIQSPYVVDVYDVNKTSDGRPFIVGEFLEGKEFASYLDEVKKLPVPVAVRIVRQICKALSAAHAKGVVHRDMKPENVFLTGDIEHPIAKVIDFGISKIGDAPGTALTKTGMIMGTPAYMAPEQARGERVDHRADIYAVGAILYCALTGKRPFERNDPTATLTAVLTEDPARPRSLEPSIPDPLELVIQRAMAKSPSDRYQTMAELDADLAAYDTFAEGGAAANAPSATAEARPQRPGTQASLERQTREVNMARPMIVLLASLSFLWAVGSFVTLVAAGFRLSKGPAQNLTGSESVLVIAVILGVLSTPLGLAVRYLKRDVWGNSVKAVVLADRMKAPVLIGLIAYGLASILVRFIEIILVRKAAGLAWPVWDVLLALIGVAAAAAAFKLDEAERRPKA